tara:strand:- start:105 stop:314 length:210 start_codon:yes stop_codon:yes gene_type:complete
MTTLALPFWNFTCKTCIIIRNSIVAIWVAMIAVGETAGRARAARELTRLGYHSEAKAVMLELKKIRGEL